MKTPNWSWSYRAGLMERLCFQFMVPVNVGMLVGDKVIRAQVEPEKRFLVVPQAGGDPVHTTCIGNSFRTHAARNGTTFSRIILSRSSRRTIDERGVFSSTRWGEKGGYAFDNEESLVGLAGIGGPIFNYTAKPWPVSS